MGGWTVSMVEVIIHTTVTFQLSLVRMIMIFCTINFLQILYGLFYV